MNLDIKTFGGPLNPPKGEVVAIELIEHIKPFEQNIHNATFLSGDIAEKILTRSKDLRQHIQPIHHIQLIQPIYPILPSTSLITLNNSFVFFKNLYPFIKDHGSIPCFLLYRLIWYKSFQCARISA
jgi:hypothetical protein